MVTPQLQSRNRDIDKNQQHVEKILQSLKNTGFVNYFGMQRFGTQSVSSHTIGLALLKGDWSRAVDLILMPRASGKDELVNMWYLDQKDHHYCLTLPYSTIIDDEETSKGRHIWKDTRQPHEALKLFPKWYVAERAVLQYFIDRKNVKDCAGALNAVRCREHSPIPVLPSIFGY